MSDKDTMLVPLDEAEVSTALSAKESLDALLARIREATTTLVPDVETSEGRKAIGSLAYKVARSKTAIDDVGKDLVAGWKRQAASVDAMRKHARDTLDALKDEVRKPLTEWEEEQARIEREEVERIAREREAEEAARRAELEAREAEVRRREAELAEADRVQREAAEAQRLAQEQAEREERIRQQAAEDARIALERQREAERLEAERKAAAEAEAERRRVHDVEHRRAVKAGARDALVGLGVARETATEVITMIASGKVPGVAIHY